MTILAVLCAVTGTHGVVAMDGMIQWLDHPHGPPTRLEPVVAAAAIGHRVLKHVVQRTQERLIRFGDIACVLINQE